jgi:hypothetical protein
VGRDQSAGGPEDDSWPKTEHPPAGGVRQCPIFPAKDVAAWLGNSVPVAMRHYAMPRAETFLAAAGMPAAGGCGSICGSTGGSIKGENDPAEEISRARKNPDSLKELGILSAGEASLVAAGMGDEGLEPPASSV